MAVDLVCHMEVDESQPDVLSIQFKGNTYYFCTELCRVQFRADPEKYIKEFNQDKNRRQHKGSGNNPGA